MEWIAAANERNAERRRREIIETGSPTLWENICRGIEAAVRYYGKLDSGLPVEFSGRATHTIWVAVFEEKQHHERGRERERLTITFNQEKQQIEVCSSLDGAMKIFPIGVNASDHVCLIYDKREISTEQFAEIALKKAFFPQSD
jgi:hypothetical protein